MRRFPAILASATLFTGLITFAGCHKMEDAPPDPTIDYPAAYVINGESNSISVIDLTSNEVKGTISLGETSIPSHGSGGVAPDVAWPHHIYLNPSRTQLAIGVPGMDLSEGHSGGMAGMKGKAVIIDAQTGKITQTIELPIMNHNAAFSPDGSEIWTAQMAEAGKVLVYDAATYALKNTLEVGSQPAEVTFSADGSTAFVANGGSNTVTAIRVADKSVVKTIPVGADPVGAWPGSDNKMYVDNEEGQTVTVIAAASLAVEETVGLGFMPGMAALNASKNELWVSDAGNGKVVYFQRMNNAWMNMGSIPTGAGAHAIAFSNDGKTAYVTNQKASSVSVINTDTKAKVKDIAVGKKPNGVILKQ